MFPTPRHPYPQFPIWMGALGSAGIIGRACSSGSHMISTMQVRSQSWALPMASAISDGLSTRIPRAPKDSASLTKSGSHLRVVLEYLSFQNSFCHCLTMPRVPLFRRTTVTGRSSAMDVATSCMTIWNPPSPVTAMTFLSGRAAFAPMAAGRPYPMVPNVPEESSWRGRSMSRKCIAHIWFWPTSVVTMVSSSMTLLSSCMTAWGLMGTASGQGSQQHLPLASPALAVQSPEPPDCPSLSRIRRSPLAQSHRRFALGCPCFPNSVASMSMWTTRPHGSPILLLAPYVLSENLLPTAITRSASFIMVRAAILPCIPRGPMHSS